MTDEIPAAPVPPTDAAPEIQAPPAEPVAESAPAETTAPDDAGQETREDRVPDSVQKRIDKAIGKMREFERRAQALESRNDELVDLLANAGVLKEPGQSPPAELKRPTRAEFEFDEEKYEAALETYLEAKAERAAERKLEALRQQATETKAVQTYESRAKIFAESVPDFAEVTGDRSLPISRPMAEVIRSSEVGPALYYHLAKNREVSAEIAQLPPHLAAYELGRIEARLSQPKPTPPAPKPKVSSAPPPPPTIEATDPVVEKDPHKMTDAEFKRWRERQIAQRR